MDYIHISASFILHVHHSGLFSFSVIHSCFLLSYFHTGITGTGFSVSSALCPALSPCNFHLLLLPEEHIEGKKYVECLGEKFLLEVVLTWTERFLLKHLKMYILKEGDYIKMTSVLWLTECSILQSSAQIWTPLTQNYVLIVEILVT